MPVLHFSLAELRFPLHLHRALPFRAHPGLPALPHRQAHRALAFRDLALPGAAPRQAPEGAKGPLLFALHGTWPLHGVGVPPALQG